MSMMRCDRHGHWDSDNWETCPQCESLLVVLEAAVELLEKEKLDLGTENVRLLRKLAEVETARTMLRADFENYQSKSVKLSDAITRAYEDSQEWPNVQDRP